MKKIWNTLLEMYRMPKLAICLPTADESQRLVYQSFTKPHPRLKVISNKAWGVELVNVFDFASFDEFLKSISGKNSAVYFARRCAKLGYAVREFDPQELQETIIDIHRSAGSRQGRSIDASYLDSQNVYPVGDAHRYFGVFLNNALVAYVWVRLNGSLAIFNRIMGHNDHLKNNVMYLLCVETMEKLFQRPDIKHVMYDTYFGASEGLKLFKKRIGFKPYHVKWRAC